MFEDDYEFGKKMREEHPAFFRVTSTILLAVIVGLVIAAVIAAVVGP